jgi:hypothetical protein
LFIVIALPFFVVAVRRSKPVKASPTFDKINLERLKQCAETTDSAKRAINTSKRLTEQSRQLLKTIHKDRSKAS